MELLNEAQIDVALQNLSGWNPTGKDIRKEFEFPDFIEAMGFVNRVAELAEEANHHPDIDIRYNKVRSSWRYGATTWVESPKGTCV